jgi:hypothetical protein
MQYILIKKNFFLLINLKNYPINFFTTKFYLKEIFFCSKNKILAKKLIFFLRNFKGKKINCKKENN